MATYDGLARLYDLEYAGFTDDIDFWLEMAQEAGGAVLELGCGTGRVMLPLAQAGYTVTGIEESPAMLERARVRLNANAAVARRATLVQASMTDFEAAGQFALSIVPLNAFMHLTTLAEQSAALACVRRHLKPGGLLVLDLPNAGEAYAGDSAALSLERTFPGEGGDGMVLLLASTHLDRASQLAHVTWIYDEVGPGGAVQRTVAPLTFRYFFPAEMVLLLEKAGLRLAHLYGDYEQAPFADGSPRMLVVAQAV